MLSFVVNFNKDFFKKAVLYLLTFVILLISLSVPSLAASSNTPKFGQGIQGVSCYNAVSASEYPVLHMAVNAAIADWDWHLGLLNNQHGTNYNFVTLEQKENYFFPMIEFVVCESDAMVENTNYLASTRFFYNAKFENGVGSRNENILCEEDWESTVIEFYIDQIREAAIASNYQQLRSMANHEIGHALGLEHTTDGDDGVLMYYSQSRTAVVPTAADLEAVYNLYG